LIRANGPESANVKEAKMLARNAIQIMRKITGPASAEVFNGIDALFRIKVMTKKIMGMR
jgi:hypothetical protein